MQPKEQTKAQRRAISRMLQKSPGLPQLASRSNAGKGQSGTVSLKKWRDYGREVFSLETGRLTGPQTGISLLVKTKSRSNWLFSVKTTPRAQPLPPPHPPSIQALAAESYWRQVIFPVGHSPSFTSCSHSHLEIWALKASGGPNPEPKAPVFPGKRWLGEPACPLFLLAAGAPITSLISQTCTSASPYL